MANANIIKEPMYYLPAGIDNNDGLLTYDDKLKLNGIASGAEVNQNAFSSIDVTQGSTTTNIAADSKTDKLTLVAGDNITLTSDATNDKITISGTASSYTAGTGIDITSGTISNSGVRAVAQGTTNGTINVNTNGSTADVAVKGLGSVAYKNSVSKSDVGLGNVANIDQSKAISSITRSGTTFTATALDGSTSTFTQQDNNTTYSDATTTASGLMSASDKVKLNGVASGAEVNQNAFSNIKVGSTTVEADGKTDTFELAAGSNITLTPDATNDKITIAATNTTYTGANGVSLSGTTFSNSGVRSISEGTTAGTINVNTNGSTANVAVKDAGKAVKSITRNGTTFTATAIDGSTFSFTQQDSDTTYSGANGISLSGTTFSNSGVRAVATGSNNGTINVNTNGSTANVAVKGLGDAAYKAVTTSVTSGSGDLVTSGAVFTAIDNLPEPMVFKGSLGTGGTITTLPTAAAANTGYTYKVITAGTYASQAAKAGDLFISDGSNWVYIPSADEPSGTVTSIATGVGLTGGTITSSGTLKAKLRSETALTIDSAAATTTDGRVYPVVPDKTGYLAVNVPWTDNNTTYSGANGISLSGTTFSNSGVRSIAQGTTNGTINVNTNGSTADVAVKGLGAMAYKASVSKSDVGLGNVANYDQSKAIKSITRSGTTFTATAIDGTTSSFTQQDNNTTYSDATTSASGLMSSSDKVKLNGIATGATANTGTVTSVAAGTGLTGGTITGSGTLAVSYGTIAGTACQGNDSRLSQVYVSGPNAFGTVTASTTDLEDGVSSLASGAIYLVYEA